MSKCSHPEKIRHVSFATALAALESLDRKGRRDLTIHPYPCGNHWHTGHRSESLNRQLKKALHAGRVNRRRRKR